MAVYSFKSSYFFNGLLLDEPTFIILNSLKIKHHKHVNTKNYFFASAISSTNFSLDFIRLLRKEEVQNLVMLNDVTAIQPKMNKDATKKNFLEIAWVHTKLTKYIIRTTSITCNIPSLE